jgi:hypothetical protein
MPQFFPEFFKEVFTTKGMPRSSAHCVQTETAAIKLIWGSMCLDVFELDRLESKGFRDDRLDISSIVLGTLRILYIIRNSRDLSAIRTIL